MQVILRSDVDGLGHKGDVVDVTKGHARNYLLPRGLAFHASPGALAQAESMRRARAVRDAADRSAAEEIATKLVGSPVTITARVGAEDKLFGSVTAADIADAVATQTGVTIDRKQLHLEEPLRTVGTHLVQLRLHPQVEFPVTVEVVGS